jgi:hypothetical protein
MSAYFPVGNAGPGVVEGMGARSSAKISAHPGPRTSVRRGLILGGLSSIAVVMIILTSSVAAAITLKTVLKKPYSGFDASYGSVTSTCGARAATAGASFAPSVGRGSAVVSARVDSSPGCQPSQYEYQTSTAVLAFYGANFTGTARSITLQVHWHLTFKAGYNASQAGTGQSAYASVRVSSFGYLYDSTTNSTVNTNTWARSIQSFNGSAGWAVLKLPVNLTLKATLTAGDKYWIYAAIEFVAMAKVSTNGTSLAWATLGTDRAGTGAAGVDLLSITY